MYLYQTLSINIILKSIKGHNSVKKFGKIICIRQYSSQHGSYTCISMHKQNCIKIHQLKNNENLFVIVLPFIFSISLHLQNFTKILQFVHQACCACSRCGMGGLFLCVFSSRLSYVSFSNASSLGWRLDILKYCGLGHYNPMVLVSYYRRRAR